MFLDPLLLQLEDQDADDASSRAATLDMLDRAKQEDFPSERWPAYESLIWSHTSELRTSFSTVPAKVAPLRIELTNDAHPVRVKQRN